MKMNRFKLAKMVWIIMLAVIVIFAGFLHVTDTFADGGSMTVGVSSADLTDGTSFTFRMYRIGGFDGPVFAKEAPFDRSKADVSMPKREDYAGTEEEWVQKWQDAADTLKADVESGALGDRDEIATAVGGSKTFSIAAGGSMSVSLPKDGLYLLIGEPAVSGGMKWTPAPTFVGMLNGSPLNISEVNIKLSSMPVVFRHEVIKSWTRPADADGQAIDDAVRPTEIRVRLSYGGRAVDTVTLSEANNWMYRWESVEDESGYEYIALDKDGKEVSRSRIDGVTEKGEWTVAEVTRPGDDGPDADNAARIRYYNIKGGGTGVVEQDDQGDIERFRITNELTPKTLRIRKTLDGYDVDGQNVTIVFSITGKNAEGEVIYRNHPAINFGPGDDLTKETVIRGVPYDVTTIEAEEEYSGNYDKSSDIKVTEETSEDGSVTGWTVTASNKHDGHGPKGGAVNKYRLGKDTEQDFGTR